MTSKQLTSACRIAPSTKEEMESMCLAIGHKRPRENLQEGTEKTPRRGEGSWIRTEAFCANPFILDTCKEFLYAMQSDEGRRAMVKALMEKKDLWTYIQPIGIGEITVHLRTLFYADSVCATILSYI
jgi:hypothetical protein